jgi:hypothetical protein
MKAFLSLPKQERNWQERAVPEDLHMRRLKNERQEEKCRVYFTLRI